MTLPFVSRKWHEHSVCAMETEIWDLRRKNKELRERERARMVCCAAIEQDAADARRELEQLQAECSGLRERVQLLGEDNRELRRRYDTARYYDIIAYMREKMPDVAITSDIIVGFPGESEEDFAGTLNMLERVQFDMLYSFIYSPRKGTPAASMEDQIPKSVQSERFSRLLKLQERIGLAKNEAYIGKCVRVLCDGVSKSNNALYSGRNEGNKIVFFEGNEQDVGEFIDVLVERADPYALYGKKKEN